MKVNRTDYYVYELLDPLNNFVPFYVGKGREYRVTHHYTPKYVQKRSHKSHIIRRYREAGLKDCYVIVASRLTEKESFDIEKKLISYAGYKKSGGLLVNISEGGEGSSGCNQPKTVEHRMAISKAKKGQKFSEEHKKALSSARKGIEITKEQRRKISASLKGRVPTEEHRKNLSKALKGRKK